MPHSTAPQRLRQQSNASLHASTKYMCSSTLFNQKPASCAQLTVISIVLIILYKKLILKNKSLLIFKISLLVVVN